MEDTLPPLLPVPAGWEWQRPNLSKKLGLPE